MVCWQEISVTWREFDVEPKNITVLCAQYFHNVASFCFQFTHEIEEYESGKWKALAIDCYVSVPVPEVTLAEFVQKIKVRFISWRDNLDSEKTIRDVVEGYIGQAWNIT